MAPSKSKVPQFGAWESEDNVGYTVRFETVRKGNNPGGPIINPNELLANQVASSTPPPPPHQTKPKQKQPEFGAWDEEEEVPYTQYFENRGGKGKASPSEPQMNYNVAPTPPVKAAPGGEFRKADPRQGSTNTRSNDYHRPNNGGRGTNSVEPQGVKFVEPKQSPLHPAAAGRGRGTTPVGPRHRPQPTAGPSPGRAGGASVPVFGDWNNNPTQADGYTVVFNKLQEDKRNGNVPSVDTTPTRPHYTPSRPTKKQPGCMSWLFG